LHQDFFHPDFSYSFPAINKELVYACDEETSLGTMQHVQIQHGVSVDINLVRPAG
jgi:hypothetical protein